MIVPLRTTSLFTPAQLAIIAKYLHAYPRLAVAFHNAKVSEDAARQFAADLARMPVPLDVTAAEAQEIARLRVALGPRRRTEA